MPPSSPLKQLKLINFRAFANFSISFGEGAYLVGANSAGKSTILTALRTSAVLLRQAYRRGPDTLQSDHGLNVRAYPLSLREFPALNDSLRHEFGSAEARIELTWKSGSKLIAVWPEIVQDETDEDSEDETSPYFYLVRSNGLPVLSAAAAKTEFPELGIIPVLAPVEHTEELLSPKYVAANQSTRLSSRHFRNQLLTLKDAGQLEDFLFWARPWLGEISLEDLEQEITSKGVVLHLFIGESDSRIPKELVWIGDGLQIWLQILYHVYRLRSYPTIVLDEPEVYLHPDLQRRLVLLLESLDAQVIVATHSSEMLVESDGRLAMLVDKSRKTARKPRSEAEFQAISASLGSAFNLRLARALRSRVALFVEGTDMKVLKRFCTTLDLTALATESGVTIIPLNGYSQWGKVEPFAWLSSELLPNALQNFVILDRDYRTDVTCASVEEQFTKAGIGAHIWQRKELESYLLTSSVMSRLSGAPEEYINEHLSEITDAMENEVFGRLLQDYLLCNVSGSKHAVDVTTEFKKTFDENWKSFDFRIVTCPPKQILSKLNSQLQSDSFKSLSATGLARAHRKAEIPSEMVDVLQALENLVSSAA